MLNYVILSDYISLNDEEDTITLAAATTSFANRLSLVPVSGWAEIIQGMEDQEIKNLFPNNATIAEFLPKLKVSANNMNAALDLQIIFLNSLGPKFKVLFPKGRSFLNLLERLKVINDPAWLMIYVPHVHALNQLEHIFTVLPRPLLVQFIIELGDRIHSLDARVFSHDKIEGILGKSTNEFMLWKYFKENHAKTFKHKRELFSTIDNILGSCLADIAAQRHSRFSFLSWNHPGPDAADMLLLLFKVSRNRSLETKKTLLLDELALLGNRDLSASMQFVFCIVSIHDCLRSQQNASNEKLAYASSIPEQFSTNGKTATEEVTLTPRNLIRYN